MVIQLLTCIQFVIQKLRITLKKKKVSIIDECTSSRASAVILADKHCQTEFYEEYDWHNEGKVPSDKKKSEQEIQHEQTHSVLIKLIHFLVIGTILTMIAIVFVFLHIAVTIKNGKFTPSNNLDVFHPCSEFPFIFISVLVWYAFRYFGILYVHKKRRNGKKPDIPPNQDPTNLSTKARYNRFIEDQIRQAELIIPSDFDVETSNTGTILSQTVTGRGYHPRSRVVVSKNWKPWEYDSDEEESASIVRMATKSKISRMKSVKKFSRSIVSLQATNVSINTTGLDRLTPRTKKGRTGRQHISFASPQKERV